MPELPTVSEHLPSSISSSSSAVMKHQQQLMAIRHALVLYLMPFCYGAATRLPFIYFVIFLVEEFELSWIVIGCLVGSYQACRIITNSLALFSPRVSHWVGTCIGIAGNIILLTMDTQKLEVFCTGTVLIGFSETYAAFQRYVKEDQALNQNMNLLKHKMKLQYAAVQVGVTVAFLLGGILFDHYSTTGVAAFGAALLSAEVLMLLVVWVVERIEMKQQQSTTSCEEAGNERTVSISNDDIENHHPHTEDEFESSSLEVAIARHRCASLIHARASQIMDGQEANDATRARVQKALDGHSASDIPANYIVYILCITVGIEAVTIGYNLSISPVYMYTQFHRQMTLVGTIFAIGAGVGTALSILATLTKRGAAFCRRVFPSPNLLFVSMTFIAIGVFLAAIPNIWCATLGIVLLSAFNELATMVLVEMLSSISSSKAYAVAGPASQVIRRSLNVVTAITGPFLFGVLPQLAYIVAGIITGSWTIFLFCIISIRRRRIINDIDKHFKKNSTLSSIDKTMIAEEVARMSFVTQEIVARQAGAGMILPSKDDKVQLSEEP